MKKTLFAFTVVAFLAASGCFAEAKKVSSSDHNSQPHTKYERELKNSGNSNITVRITTDSSSGVKTYKNDTPDRPGKSTNGKSTKNKKDKKDDRNSVKVSRKDPPKNKTSEKTCKSSGSAGKVEIKTVAVLPEVNVKITPAGITVVTD